MKQIQLDAKRQMIIPGDHDATLFYAVQDWIKTANHAISKQGYFAVALSGGSTPREIYAGLAHHKDSLDWSKVLLFWSDERACSMNDEKSNYRMAMESGLNALPLLKQNIFPMNGLGDLEENAREYEACIARHIPSKSFDLMMLGMGDDGHTASLFPKTHGLHTQGREVIANFLPDKNIWRLSVTFECINQSEKTVVYILGSSKADMVYQVFSDPSLVNTFPIQNVGKESRAAFFILDEDAARKAFI